MQMNFEKILFLKTVPLFDKLAESILSDIIQQCYEVTASAGSTIIKQGQLFDSMYIIVQGSVSVLQNGKTIAKMKSGDIFGEIYALSPLQSDYTIQADTDTLMFQIGSSEFYSLIDDYPDFTQTIIPDLCRKLRETGCLVI